jgi:hypothetical protein
MPFFVGNMNYIRERGIFYLTKFGEEQRGARQKLQSFTLQGEREPFY